VTVARRFVEFYTSSVTKNVSVAPGNHSGTTSSASSVLIDNSTYFSAKRLLYENLLDAYTLFNLANFLECVVVAENVMLAPTLAWEPGEEDSLFRNDGPCAKVRLEDWPDDDLGFLFDSAIRAGIKSLSSSGFGYQDHDVDAALRLLRQWRSDVQDSPRDFLIQYSGAVYINDTASREAVAAMPTVTGVDASPCYHLAQYILRSNVAYELSSIWTYHPHSHRLSFISQRMQGANRESLHLGQELIRAAEVRIGQEIETQRRTALLANFGAFKHELRLPLILSSVLSQSRSADEIVPIALQLRQSSSARRYRRWVNELIAAVDSNDYKRQLTAEREFDSAGQSLMRELHELYSPSKNGLIQKTSTYAATLDPDALNKEMAEDWPGLAMSAGAMTANVLGIFDPVLRQRRRRRNFVFLLEIAKHRRNILAINQLLEPVFGIALSDGELTRLHNLQSEQSKGCAEIAKLASYSAAPRQRGGHISRSEADIGVITVLSEETRAVSSLMRRSANYRRYQNPDGLLLEECLLGSRQAPVRVVATQAVERGPLSAVTAFANLRHSYATPVVAVVGIAGSIHPSAREGDVVVADEVIYYDHRKETPHGENRRGTSKTAPTLVRRAVNNFFSDQGEPSACTATNPSGTQQAFLVHRGPIGSGHTVIADENSLIKTYLENYNDKILAVDTETGGLAQAFYEEPSSAGEGGWLAIRGISDRADTVKNDTHHHIAAWHAALTLERIAPYLKPGHA
jgi:adenosylhomocysteine nucleosidase